MQKGKVIMISTAPIVNGPTMTREALVDGARQINKRGLPALASHDHHRPIGWLTQAWVEDKAGISYLVADEEFPESREDWEELLSRYEKFQKDDLKLLVEEAAPRLDTLLQLIPGATYTLTGAGIAVRSRDIVKTVVPEILKNTDRDNLISYRALQPIATGTFRAGDWCIFAHKGLRRSFSRFNSFNADFFERIESLTGRNPKMNVSISLDPDLMSHPIAAREPVELAYWWGPKFKDDLAAINPGVSVHANSKDDQSFHKLERTEFFWSSRDGKHTLEIEELVQEANILDEGPRSFGTRYLHTIVDEKTGAIEHCDGAVKVYDQQDYDKRRAPAVDISKAPKATRYHKLWRVYGTMALADWKALIHDYYRDNNAIAEYFGCPREDT
jgi:hypothetical protein